MIKFRNKRNEKNKRNKRNKRNDLFYNYLISYVVLLVVPVLIISTIIYTNFFDVLSEELVSNDKKILMQVSKSIDDNLLNMLKVSTSMRTNNKFDYFYMQESSYVQSEGITSLKTYLAANGFVSDIFWYKYGSNKIYGATGAYSTGDLTDSFATYTNLSNEAITEDIKNIEDSNDFYVKPYAQYTLFYFPVLFKDNHSYVTTIFIVENNRFKNAIRGEVGQKDTTVSIFDINKKMLITSSREFENEMYDFDIPNHIDQNKKINIVNISNERYLVQYFQSDNSGFSYIKYTPIERVMGKVNEIKNKVILVMIVIIIIGIIIIVISMRTNYIPILNIKSKIQGYSDNFDKISNFEHITTAIDDIFSSNTQLLDKVTDFKKRLKEQLLLKLLNGQVQNWEEFNMLAKELGFNYIYEKFRIVVTKLHDSDMYDKKDRMKTELENILDEYNYLAVYDLIQYNEHAGIYIINYDKITKEEFEQALNNNEYVKSIVCVVGNECTDISQISKAYLKAVTVLDEIEVNGNTTIFFCDDDNTNRPLMTYDHNSLKKMEQALSQKNIIEAKNVIDSILSGFEQKENSLLFLKYVFFDIVNTIINACQALNINVLTIDVDYIDVIMLSQMTSVAEFKQAIFKVIDEINSIILSEQKDMNIQLKYDIVKYVEKRFNDPNFSIQEIAEQFNYSYKYLSRYFKEQAGYNLSDYIGRIRMDYAKKYLRETNEPLYEIVNKVGYDNIVSFRRRFKDLEGVTPNQYRDLVNNKNQNEG